MSVAEKPKRNLQTTVTLDAGTLELLEALAVAVSNGSRSGAIRHLVELHAGRLREQAEPIEAEQVDEWKRHRLSRELIGEVAARMRKGATRTDAYQLSGVTSSQAQGWLTTGRADVRAGRTSLHADFVMHLEKVEAEVRLERLQKIKDEKWHLERDPSGQYAKVTRTDSTVTHQYNLVIDWEKGSLQETRELVRLLRIFSPEPGTTPLGRHDRPALDVVPAEIMAAVIEDAEYEELEDESTDASSDAPLREEPVLTQHNTETNFDADEQP